MANKIKYGLKNVHIFPIDNETEEYEQVFKIKGAVSLTLKANGDSNPFYADDEIYYNEFSNNGYEGNLEIALVPEDFEIQILGMIKDTNGAIVEVKNAKTKKYAMAFEIDGDVNETRFIFYKCDSGRPDFETKTREEKIDPNTDKLSITATPDKDGHVKAKLQKGQTGYDTFFTTVYKMLGQGV